MAFDFAQKVLFRHCDPAGIVFYPRYFEMINDCVEAFFDDVVGTPFEALLRDGGVPTVQTSVTFHAPSRHGDRLVLALSPVRLGRRSFTYDIVARAGQQTRFSGRATLVYVGPDGAARDWPADIKTALTQFSEDRS